MKAVIVVPTIREKSIIKWLKKWDKEFSNQDIIIIEDSPQKKINIPIKNKIYHYSWKEIDEELGEKSWIIPRKTDCIRSFGYIKAYQFNPEIVVTLDDDCYPDDKNFLKLHEEVIDKKYYHHWMQHFQGERVRGMPYNLAKSDCVLNIGLWSNNPDYDAKTQIKNQNCRSKKIFFNYPAPKDYFVPVCGMNLAFRKEIIPAFYFLLMGRNYNFDRFGDIWSGIFLKKICDHLGYTICGGYPYVRHEKASNPRINLIKEKPGMKINEFIWKDIKAINLKGKNFKDCYYSLANQVPEYDEYWIKLKKAMKIWVSLF